MNEWISLVHQLFLSSSNGDELIRLSADISLVGEFDVGVDESRWTRMLQFDD